MASRTNIIPNTTGLDETLDIMGLLTNASITFEVQMQVAVLFANTEFMELLKDISDIAYGKTDACLVQFLGTHSIVPDTESRMLRHVILAYLIARKQGDCAAALNKFKSAYDKTVSILQGRAADIPSPDWKLSLLAQ